MGERDCWACYYGPEDPERWKDRHTCGGQRAVDRTGLSRVFGTQEAARVVALRRALKVAVRALEQHRVDMHQASPRPCSTCAQSEQALAQARAALEQFPEFERGATAPPLDQEHGYSGSSTERRESEG